MLKALKLLPDCSVTVFQVPESLHRIKFNYLRLEIL